MKKLTLMLAATSALIAAPALAADLRPAYKAPMAAAMAPVYNWSGLYIGGNIGGGWSNPSYNVLTAAPAFADTIPGDVFGHDIDGITGGGQIGLNYQVGSFVFGVEGMFNAADISGSFTPFVDDTFTTTIRSLMLVTGKIGYAWNNWLLYAKGGYAGGDVRVSVLDTVAPAGAGSQSSWRDGWTVGGGLEVGFAQNWSLGVEYNYVRLERGNYEIGGGGPSYLVNVGTRDTHLVTARLNYRFNLFGGPVMASY